MLAARRMMKVEATGPKLWSFGGTNGNSTFGYNIASDTWDLATAHAAFPAPSQTHNYAFGTINGKVYAAGGFSGAGIVQSACYAYDPVADTWATLASMPTAVENCGSAVLGGKLYVVGGSTAPTLQTVVQVYDPVGNSWSTVASLPVAWEHMVCGAISGKLYAASGDTNASLFPGICYVYDPTANTWTAKTSQPTPTFASSGTAVAGKLYVIGGETSGFVLTSAVQVYDPVGNSWSTVASLPLGASDLHAACESNGKLYVSGGTTTNSAGGVVRHLYVFDPGTGSWSTLADMPVTVPAGQYAHGLAGGVAPISLIDNFNRADSATTINPAWDGNSWIIYNHVWGTSGNKGYLVNITGGTTQEPIASHAGGPGNYVTASFLGYDLGGATQTIQTDIIDRTGVPSYLLYMNVDLTNGTAYFVDFTSNGATVHRATNWSTFTTLGTLTIASWTGAGGVLGNGFTTVKMHHDGAGHLSFWQDKGSGLVSVGTFTDASPLTATNMMVALNVSGDTRLGIDNFSATPY